MYTVCIYVCTVIIAVLPYNHEIFPLSARVEKQRLEEDIIAVLDRVLNKAG